MHLPPIQDLYFVIILLMIGSVAGYTAGLFGLGGGVVLVPTLMTLFPFFGASHARVVHCAVGTALALVVPATMASAYKHYKLQNVDLKFAKRWLPSVVSGAIIGTLSFHYISGLLLKIIFTAYLYCAFVYTLTQHTQFKAVKSYPHKKRAYVGAGIIGCASVWLGLGGGTFTVPFLRFLKYPYRKAIGISATSGITIGLVGAIGVIIHGWGLSGRPVYSLGYVNGMAFIIIAPVVMLLAPQGAKMAHRLKESTIKHLYAGLLFIIALYMTAMTIYMQWFF
ncbi:MAG: sulfite exporter TauE/SafE family protein [Gammaproteobacteria bacterium]|nr:sulfite exporter TauE/SafE family protein [Gammaproteobacteria bacterium]